MLILKNIDLLDDRQFEKSVYCNSGFIDVLTL